MSKLRILNASLAELAVIKAASSSLRTEKINADNTLNFSIRVKSGLAAYINDTNVIGLDGDYFDIASYKKEQQSDGSLMVSVECEHISYRLNNASYNVEYFTQIGTPSQIFGAILAGTGFTAGTVQFSGATTFSLQEAASRRALLMQFAAYVGGELSFNGFTVSLLTQRGSSTPKAVTVGKDVTVISKTVNKRELDAQGNPTVSYTCGVYKGASFDLGDVVTLNYPALDIDTELRVLSKSYDPYNPNNVTIEIGNYVNSLEDDLYRIETESVSKDALYNGCRIGPQYGFEAIRNDKKARAYFRSDGMVFQSGDGSGSSWKDRMYYAYDSETDETVLVFDGKLSAGAIEALKANIDVVISNTTITNVLSAQTGYIAQLTVDQLDTSTKVQRYLDSDTSDVNYIRISGQTIYLVTASTDGSSEEQATARNGSALYWLDDSYEGVTTEETDYPVMIYTYTELVKAEIAFYDSGGTYIPRILMGAGTGSGDNDKLMITKPQDKAIVQYTTDAGAAMTLQLSADGIEVLGNTGPKGLRNIYVGTSAPSNPQTNDLWINPDEEE